MLEQYEEYSLQTIPEDRECSLSRLYDYLVVTDDEGLKDRSMDQEDTKKYIFNGVIYD